MNKKAGRCSALRDSGKLKSNTNVIHFRLRPVKDDDIKKALEMIHISRDRSDIIRAALRAFFHVGGY
jgi:hypothetical protein